jgi:uncharacterized membrane protein YfcA
VFLLALFALAVLSGATASVAGFGIGSLLTPLLATRLGAATAIAAVAIPHAAATALRFWRLRAAVDWRVIQSFGLLSAVGGLVGAMLYARLSSRVLTMVLGLLLVATAIAGLTGWATRWRATGLAAPALGWLSGFFGGIAGNQGGLRAAALLGFDLAPAAYVATSTTVALLVDAARTPVYVWRAGSALVSLATPITIATLGVLVGTLLGERLLLGLPVERFRRIVSALIGLLGIWLLASL